MTNTSSRSALSDGVLAGHMEPFRQWLHGEGCSEETSGQYVGVCRKFGRYLEEHAIVLAAVQDGDMDAFLDEIRPRRGSLAESRRYHRTGIGRLLDYLQATGTCPTPIDSFLDGHATRLRERNYTEKTIAQHLGTCRGFGRYLRRKGIAASVLSETDTDGFLEQLPRGRVRQPKRTARRRDYRRRIRLFLDHLREIGACPPPTSRTPTDPVLVTDYLTFLRQHRGLTAAYIEDQGCQLRRFLAHAGNDGTVEQLRMLSARHVDEFLVEASRRRKRTSMNHVCATVRGFFRFLHIKSVLINDLSLQVATPRIYQLEGVPRSASWADVDRTLATVNRTTLVGRRDYAILILLAYYGLRAHEVSMLRLGDLGWRNDELRVRRAKGGSTDALPLIPVVGNALLSYLEVRPASDRQELFLKVIAPAGPISGPSVSWLAHKYLSAAGVKAPLLGAHTLRHSHAIRLLRAGFPLKTIGDTLGHTCPQSTFIYSKAPTEELRSVGLDLTEIRP
jgi:site-specific recombinase XerD